MCMTIFEKFIEGMYGKSIHYYVRALAMNPKVESAWKYLRISYGVLPRMTCWTLVTTVICFVFLNGSITAEADPTNLEVVLATGVSHTNGWSRHLSEETDGLFSKEAIMLPAIYEGLQA